MSASVWLSGTWFPDAGVLQYLPVFGPQHFLHPNYYTLMPCAGTIDRFRVVLTVAPGVGLGRVFEVYKNGVATGVICAITGTDTTGSDLTHNVAVAAGDRIHIQMDADVGVAAANVRFSLQFDSTTAKQTVLSGVCPNLHQVDTLYMPLSGAVGVAGSNNELASLVVPCSGTIKSLYVWLSAAPGGARFNWARRKFTVSLNGVNQALTCTVVGNNTTCNDTTNSFAVAAGNWICVECEPIAQAGSPFDPPAAAHASVSVVLETANEGEFIVPVVGTGWISQDDAEYNLICGGIVPWQATEGPAQCLSQRIKFTRLQARLGAAVQLPGNEFRFRFRKNGATPVAYLGCDITFPDESGFGTGTIIAEDDDLVNFYVSPISTPAKNTAVVSMLARVWRPPRLVSTF